MLYFEFKTLFLCLHFQNNQSAWAPKNSSYHVSCP